MKAIRKSLKDKSLQELAEGVMDLVTRVAGRRFVQALEYVHEIEIAPRIARIEALEKEVAELRAALKRDRP